MSNFFVTPRTALHQASLSFTISQSLLILTSAESVMLSTISSSVSPFSSCPQSFPASGSFPMSWFFVSSGQSIGASASASVLLMNTQDWFSLGWTWLDLLAVQGTLQESSPAPQFKNINSLVFSCFYGPTHHIPRYADDYWKNHSFDHIDVLQARILEWVATPSSRKSSWPRDRIHVSCISCIGRWVL